MENQLKSTKELEIKLNNKLIELNDVLFSSINILKSGNNIFKLSSSEKNIHQLEIKPRDLINMTLRVNTNYSAPFGDLITLPGSFLNPYPLEEREMKNTFLKFNLNPNQRLKPPIIKPFDNIVGKGTPLELSYPDKSMSDVFFRYTISENFIPTFFSGEKVKKVFKF